MMRPSPENLLSETARLAYHLHWPLDTILDLEHPDRRRFLTEVDQLAAGEVERPGPAEVDPLGGAGLDRLGEARGPILEES